MRKIILGASALLITMCVCLSSLAGGASYQDEFDRVENGGHFMFAPFFWMSQMSGPITVLGQRRNVDVSFGNMFANLDFAFQGYIEGGKGPWTLILDPSYLSVSNNSSGVGVTTQLGLLDFGLYYRFYSRYLSSDRYIALEVLGGGRYMGGNINLAAPVSGNVGVSIAAPMIGIRLKYRFVEKAWLWLSGDVGGFGVDGVNNTWSAMIGVSYLVHRYIDVAVAYKLLKVDYTKPAVGFDTLMYGPMVGLVFHWP